MAEKAGKVGAFYATSGTGHLTTAESHTLSSNQTYLSNKNVVVTDVYKNKQGSGTKSQDWYCTVMGLLTVNDVAATDTVSVTYRWYAEEGAAKADTGAIKKYGGFFNWSLDYTADVLDITDFSDSGHRQYLANVDNWAATAERHWVDSGLLTFRGDKIIAKFYVNDSDTAKGTDTDSDTGDRYEGWCFITGLSPSTAVDSLTNESLSFQGTGVLTYES